MGALATTLAIGLWLPPGQRATAVAPSDAADTAALDRVPNPDVDDSCGIDVTLVNTCDVPLHDPAGNHSADVFPSRCRGVDRRSSDEHRQRPPRTGGTGGLLELLGALAVLGGLLRYQLRRLGYQLRNRVDHD